MGSLKHGYLSEEEVEEAPNSPLSALAVAKGRGWGPITGPPRMEGVSIVG